MSAFIDEHRARLGVEPICRAVPVATLVGGAGGPDGIGVNSNLSGAVIVQTYTTADPPTAADGPLTLIVFDSSPTG